MILKYRQSDGKWKTVGVYEAVAYPQTAAQDLRAKLIDRSDHADWRHVIVVELRDEPR